MLIGASLYRAEGYKNFNTARKNYPYIGFSNSDPQMLMLFMIFLKDVLMIEKEKMRLEIHIYPQQSLADACTYWRGITGIPEERIKAYVAVSPASRGKRPKNLLPHGTAYLRINSRQEFFKVRGLIDGIIKGIFV
ncbi:MAG: Resolvase helix-turn-helix protein [Parcubacteria group bacterium Gr01-1014_33]|nr:MAG: Resolvase helix-turn-helix protein [Parcubacteria group bacterium Gr01-1014_33]